MRMGGTLNTSDFDYDLPDELIAQEPIANRDQSRLLVIHRGEAVLEDTRFENLPRYLARGDVLVANKSRVLPARLYGSLPSGGRVELLLVRPADSNSWEVMARPARKFRQGTEISLPGEARAEVLGVGEQGRRIVRFTGTGDFGVWLRSAGRLPIPPYIRRYPDEPERYQTVYSRSEGSIAAPTAGLHFTSALLDRIRRMGVEIRYVTLHVGPGTFKPVHEEYVEAIRLEPERGSIGAVTADSIMRAKAEGRRVIAVGTTTTRLLEGLYQRRNGLGGWSGAIDLFIRPPFRFNVVDALITNFHLPRSTLLMLVAAFAGMDRTRRAYEHAIAHGYRFYSFGDAMFIA